MKNRVLLALATAAVAVAARMAVSQPAEDPLDPVRVAADTHRIAFENEFVRVLDVHLPPGKVEPRHRHPHGMSVYFTDWHAKVTPDGQADGGASPRRRALSPGARPSSTPSRTRGRPKATSSASS